MPDFKNNGEQTILQKQILETPCITQNTGPDDSRSFTPKKQPQMLLPGTNIVEGQPIFNNDFNNR